MHALTRRAILLRALCGLVGAPLALSLLSCGKHSTATAMGSGHAGLPRIAAPTATIIPSTPPEKPSAPPATPVPLAASPNTIPARPDTPTPEQGYAAGPRPSDPYRHQTSAVIASAPVSSYARRVSHIALARVTHLLPLQWETPDGARPANPHVAGASIFTPVGIAVEQVLRGEQFSRGYLKAMGGRIGQDEVILTPGLQYSYRVDERAILFLTPTSRAPERIDDLPVFDIGGKFVFDSLDGRIRNVYPTKPFGDTYELLTWPEFLAAIAPPFPPIATPAR